MIPKEGFYGSSLDSCRVYSGFYRNPFRTTPLVGYLIAGFVLQAVGVEGGEALENIANLGVTLLLFSIGLKLRLRNLNGTVDVLYSGIALEYGRLFPV